MAENPEQTNPDLAASLRKSGVAEPKPMKRREPIYKMIGESRIPVTKAHGAFWKSRYDAGKRKQSTFEDAWREAIAYYNNTAEGQREFSDGTRARNVRLGSTLGDNFSEIENVVYANTTALTPLVYSKNPTVEVSHRKDANEERSRVIERLANTLLYRRSAPHFPLKGRMRRAVVLGQLTDGAFIEVGWTQRDASSEQAIIDLQEIAGRLEKAKDVKEILKLEGELEALEQSVDLLRPTGPFSRLRLPWEVVIDPACTDLDTFEDARWIIIEDMIPTSVLRAKYAQEGRDGELHSIYKPTHVLKLRAEGGSPLEEHIDSFTLFGAGDGTSEGPDPQAYGFSDKASFDRAMYTHVQLVWDKTTRRVLMYNANDWTYPLWVWDDPYNYDNFFPIVSLRFQVSPVGGPTKGEVSYYLDQQDAINEINHERRLARRWAQRNIVFNSKRINDEQVKRLLTGKDNRALGIPLGDGEKLSDVITALLPPSTQFIELFDKGAQMQAIDRISSVSDALRGAQFKTNTTNDAIDTYNSITQTRLDEKIDAVEDCTAAIMWKVAQLCLQFMSQQEVEEVLGPDDAALWVQMQPREIRTTFSLQIVGGSVVKPSSAVKKRQAAEVGQILGQFAGASPVAFVVALKLFERAYDDVVVTAEDWQMLRTSIEAQLSGQGGGGDGEAAIDEIAEVIDALPPEAKRAIGAALARGAPIKQIIERVLANVQQTQQGETTNEPPNTTAAA